MKTAILAVVFLLIGGAIGGYVGVGFGTGMGAGGGLVMGSQAGACLAAQAARGRGILSAAQADAVIQDTIAMLKARTPLAGDQHLRWVTGEADCARMIAEMDSATPQDPNRGYPKEPGR
jgi:hypothetical protein